MAAQKQDIRRQHGKEAHKGAAGPFRVNTTKGLDDGLFAC